MLYKFSIGNYLSFRDIQTLDLVSDSLKELDSNLHTPYFFNSDERLLKSVAIYGHNSHGKTNFIKAFQFFHQLIFNSFTQGQTAASIPLSPFLLNSSSKDKPSFFEISFLVKEIKYRYKLILNSSEILKEELHYCQPKIRENFLFERTGQDIKVSKQWSRDNNGKTDQILPFVKRHILFLSVLISQQEITHIIAIQNWLISNLVVPDDYMSELKRAHAIYTDASYRHLILKFIDAADLGFKTIFDKIFARTKYDKAFLNDAYSREIKNFELYTNHSIFDDHHVEVDKIEFELLKQESAGTVKYFVLVCLLSFAIKNSQLIWVDELDARFHALLLEMLVSAFHNPEINPINSQMIFTVHNTSLLDQKLRRDQMVIVEKNEWGESFLKRAHSSAHPIRINKSLEKEYRKGKIGGVSKKVKRNLGPTLFGD